MARSLAHHDRLHLGVGGRQLRDHLERAHSGDLQRMSEGRRASEGVRREVEQNRAKMEAYERLCRELGEQSANVALAWLLHNPVVTAPIIGPRTREQLDGRLHALEIVLSPEALCKLDEIFPGPGGPAPEAYAW